MHVRGKFNLDGKLNLAVKQELSSSVTLLAGLGTDLKNFSMDPQSLNFGFKVKLSP
jgi:hypothetical protein